MFVSSNQFYYFLLCFSFGVISSPLFTVSYFIKQPIKKDLLRAIPDVCAFVILCFFYTVFAYSFSLPNLRVYMVCAVFLGIFSYMKTFNIILAKIIKKSYNIIVKKLHKKIKVRKEKNDGVKV